MNIDLDFADDIIDILNFIGDKFGIAIDWSGKTILPYLQQLGQKYITYKISVAYMWIIAMAVVAVAGFAMLIYSKVQDDGFWLFCAWCALIIAFSVALYNVYIVIECKTFPEKVLFEYVKKIYDNGNFK